MLCSFFGFLNYFVWIMEAKGVSVFVARFISFLELKISSKIMHDIFISKNKRNIGFFVSDLFFLN